MTRLLVYRIPDAVEADDLDKLAVTFLADAVLDGLPLDGYAVYPDAVVIRRLTAKHAADTLDAFGQFGIEAEIRSALNGEAV